ncbi:MAG: hypothetical protein ACTSP1_18325 [Candidatus Freyarchaeota archaeon]
MGDSNVFKAAAIALRAAAADFKKVLGLTRLFGEITLNYAQAVSRLNELAREYEEVAMQNAEMQMTQLQQKIDLYGRDYTDYDETTAVTRDDFEDYYQDKWDAM